MDLCFLGFIFCIATLLKSQSLLHFYFYFLQKEAGEEVLTPRRLPSLSLSRAPDPAELSPPFLCVRKILIMIDSVQFGAPYHICIMSVQVCMLDAWNIGIHPFKNEIYLFYKQQRHLHNMPASLNLLHPGTLLFKT